jgi:hypothetical protein
VERRSRLTGREVTGRRVVLAVTVIGCVRGAGLTTAGLGLGAGGGITLAGPNGDCCCTDWLRERSWLETGDAGRRLP